MENSELGRRVRKQPTFVVNWFSTGVPRPLSGEKPAAQAVTVRLRLRERPSGKGAVGQQVLRAEGVGAQSRGS